MANATYGKIITKSDALALPVILNVGPGLNIVEDTGIMPAATLLVYLGAYVDQLRTGQKALPAVSVTGGTTFTDSTLPTGTWT